MPLTTDASTGAQVVQTRDGEIVVPIDNPGHFVKVRCTGSDNNGKRCSRWSMWGLDVCWRHGGADPVRQKALRAAVGRFVDFMDPSGLLVRMQQMLDANLSMILKEDGSFLPMKEWPDDIWPAIASIRYVSGNIPGVQDGVQERALEVKLIPRERILELGMKQAGLLIERMAVAGRIEHEHKADASLVTSLLEGLKRAGLEAQHVNGSGSAAAALPAPAAAGDVLDVSPVREREAVAR